MIIQAIQDRSLGHENRSSSDPVAAREGVALIKEKRPRRWTPHTRTGCVTCRTRRIKCDETRPACRRCTASRLVCGGYALPLPTHRTVIGTSKRGSGDLAVKQPLQKRGICIEVQPLDWHFQEVLRYYFEVVVPNFAEESRKPAIQEVCASSRIKKIFSACAITDQVERGSKARDRLLQPGEDPVYEALWTACHKSILEIIQLVNEYLQDDAGHKDGAPATVAILQLLLCDLGTATFLWKAHLRGFYAYIRSCGGASKIMTLPKPEKSRMSPIMALTMQINTTCPADQMIPGTDDFTDDEIRTLIDFDPSKVETAPPEFHLARVHITRLRVSLALNKIPRGHASLRLRIQDLFDTLWMFDIKPWIQKRFGAHDHARQRLERRAARIFATAVRLYGILTLPEGATAAWADSSPEIQAAYPVLAGRSRYDRLRIGHRRELLGLLREHWNEAERKEGLAWPFYVVGVAVADDTLENIAYVDASLFTIWKFHPVFASSITALKKLRTFWSAGKTGWEDCFDEPIPSCTLE